MYKIACETARFDADDARRQLPSGNLLDAGLAFLKSRATPQPS
jgi:hypothetical protein